MPAKHLTLGALIGLLWPLAALAQHYPAPTLPLTGNETIACVQNGGNKACTPAEINAIGGTVSSVGLVLPASTFSVSGSPVTSSGTLTGAFVNQSANTVFAGPSSGSPATPAFRALVGTDLPLPTATTLGGDESYAAVTHQWINAVSTSGVPTSTQPAAADLSNGVTGSGAVVLAVSPSLTTPALGTPSAIVLTNGTGCAISACVSGLGAGVANFLGTPTSANLAATVTDESGSGSLLFGTAPTIINGIYNGTVAVGSASNWRTALGLATVASSGSASDLTSGTLAAARGGAGTITGALKGSGAGVVSQAACADLSNGGGGGCAAAVTSGSLTPTLAYATPGTSSFAYTTQSGQYVCVAGVVTGQMLVSFTPTNGTASGNLVWSNPPYNVQTLAVTGTGRLLGFSGPVDFGASGWASLAATTYFLAPNANTGASVLVGTVTNGLATMVTTANSTTATSKTLSAFFTYQTSTGTC